MAAIKIGINMAGAISAGAYTAGVLDFLTQALDEWEAAKSNGEAVPMHEVSIEVMSGASAGGMCAAISAILLNQDFEHIDDVQKTGTTNLLYESWVNRIDIAELLKQDDLQKNSQLHSLLDSTIINDIAEFALTPGTLKRRPYVSPNLTLFLSLTNLRGTPYSLNGSAPGSVEETTFFYGDRIRFRTQIPDISYAPDADIHLLAFSNAHAPEWGLLRTATMATGAFPVFLAPRVLPRNLAEYTPPLWESRKAAATGNPPPLEPSFPPNTPNPLFTLNVDGGMTNNDPFMYAHDYLATLDPPTNSDRATVSSTEADRLVIDIAPFPTTTGFDPGYDPAKSSGVGAVVGQLLSALLSQARFFGESLTQVMNGPTYDRYVIAPSDQELADSNEGKKPEDIPPALQCATVGAFGGFFYRGFRAHDYALGRRNCQQFLRCWLALPQENPIIEAGLAQCDERREAVVQQFGVAPPPAYNGMTAAPIAGDSGGANWIPIIPLCGTAKLPIAPIARVTLNGKMLDQILSLAMQRFKAVMAVVLSNIRSTPFRLFLQAGQPFIRWLARSPLRDALIKGFGDSYQP